MESFICPRCGNTDERYIGYKNGKPYCRLCLPFSGREAKLDYQVNKNLSLSLNYPLSEKQRRIANLTLQAIKSNKNVLINAVTGAGKTELVYYSMEYVLKYGGHVGFATPRKDVVIDLFPRIKEAFPLAEVISVYGGHNEVLNGDIILLTTHQLYRYPNYFDLLIVDEIDAFPYANNQLLHTFFLKSIKKNYILLSATPSDDDLKRIRNDNGVVLSLTERYHKKDIPVPTFEKNSHLKMYFSCLKLLKRFLKENKPVFIFVPTIEMGKKLYAFLSLFFGSGRFVSSKEENRKLSIELFKGNSLNYLVTTSILERGVTVKNLQVIVFNADHPLYDEKALIQIAGRVGRKIDFTDGEVIFLSEKETNSINRAIYKISSYNKRNKVLNNNGK